MAAPTPAPPSADAVLIATAINAHAAALKQVTVSVNKCTAALTGVLSAMQEVVAGTMDGLSLEIVHLQAATSLLNSGRVSDEVRKAVVADLQGIAQGLRRLHDRRAAEALGTR